MTLDLTVSDYFCGAGGSSIGLHAAGLTLKMAAVVPIKLKEARRFVAETHRTHNRPPRGWLFGCALDLGPNRIGVAIGGRPTSRELDDGRTIEITRCCVAEGNPNACSILYARICRAAKALGYLDAITYTEESESGGSLRAAGFTPVAIVDGARSWDTPARRREDFNLLGEPIRTERDRLRWKRRL